MALHKRMAADQNCTAVAAEVNRVRIEDTGNDTMKKWKIGTRQDDIDSSLSLHLPRGCLHISIQTAPERGRLWTLPHPFPKLRPPSGGSIDNALLLSDRLLTSV